METRQCHSCGQRFFPASHSWGDETCGVCIAACLENMLMDSLPPRIRRPMRRAADLQATDVATLPLFEANRKAVGE